jgi:hypothetical protein
MLMGSRVAVKALPQAPAFSARRDGGRDALNQNHALTPSRSLLKVPRMCCLGGIMTHLVVQNRS